MVSIMKSVSFALVLSLLTTVSGYPYFRDLIPNGQKVPHPCKPNYVWKGVGHQNQGGGGDRNPFGRDWHANGMKWDECLCTTDSDGDGRTNGEELGDPDCKWTPGSAAATTKGLSHPGICEPLDDPKCIEKNNWEIDCSIAQYACPELDATEDVKNVTVKMDKTEVPDKETIYMCQLVELPDDGDYHLVASEPFIDNEYVMHHLLLYGCPEANVTALRKQFGTPTECGMEVLSCGALLDGWTVGSPGTCLPEEFGVRIGSQGFKYGLLEMHWNNPELRDDYTDGSGLTLYYTPKLRKNDGSSIFIGPVYLEIPPGYSEVINQGGCKPYCTEKIFEETINITSISPHMHYLGRKMTVEVKRNGQSTTVLVENDYNYDNPQDYIFDPPLEFHPGDEMVVTCSFDSSGSKSYVYYGEATADEMCLATIVYYPKQPNEASCLNNGDVGYCGEDVTRNSTAQCYASLTKLFEQDLPAFAAMMSGNCDPTGKSCWSTCPSVLEQVRQHICFQGISETATKVILAFYDSFEFIQMLVSCDERPEMYYKPFDGHKGHSHPPEVGDDSLCVTPSKAGHMSFSVFWIFALVFVGNMF